MQKAPLCEPEKYKKLETAIKQFQLCIHGLSLKMDDIIVLSRKISR